MLLALAILPLLWWLLRVTPPAARLQSFPAIQLLAGLRAREETAARTPWWLLALRLLALGLVIVGLAGPVMDAAHELPSTGPLLLIIDNGWTAAPDWAARLAAAEAALDSAERAGHDAALLTTARTVQNLPPALSPIMPAAELRAQVAALHPLPWPADRALAASALEGHFGAVTYVTDGVAAAGDTALAHAIAAVGQVTEVIAMPVQARMLLSPHADADRLVARVAILPQPVATEVAVLAQGGDGRTLARAATVLPAGGSDADLPFLLPSELRNHLTRLVLEGPATAGSVLLLDESFRRRPVGLVSAEAGANTPLTGTLYYLERALAPFTELRQGNIHTLLSRQVAVIVLADTPVEPGDAKELLAWIDKGGLLLRFAGPISAGSTDVQSGDPLMPERLLTEDRRLGGALSWSQPAKIAPFTATSPFAGLVVPDEVQVTRQVLAEPFAQLADHTWARLADGTPLVTQATHGAGRIVLFHVTANADWSNLPLSGLFPEMLRRLVDLSAGIANSPDDGVLRPAQSLDGFGVLGPLPPAATSLAGEAFAATVVSPQHPPGLYGPGDGTRALNLSNALPALRPMETINGATMQLLGVPSRQLAVGPWLMAAGLTLLVLDLLIALRLRGLWQSVAASLLFVAIPAQAQVPSPPWQAALATRLAYVMTGDPVIDNTSRDGLARLADYVNTRTAAHLADPSGVVPGQDDLSFYPLLYWPIVPGIRSSASVSAMNAFMRNGGIIVIDSRGDPNALRTVSQGLAIPPLTPLTTDHVLSRAFYLLGEYPGTTNIVPVWVQRDQDRSNDDVSPVVIGDNDWATEWASTVDSVASSPGGVRQRTLALRFGVNLVMYALTGNYKGDQVHVPHILERLGQ